MKIFRALSPYEPHHRLVPALLVIGTIAALGVLLLFAVKAVG